VGLTNCLVNFLLVYLPSFYDVFGGVQQLELLLNVVCGVYQPLVRKVLRVYEPYFEFE
jgi:hypothetical protein